VEFDDFIICVSASAAQKRHYRDNAASYKTRARKNTAIYRRRNKEFVDGLKAAPCTDCGEKFHPCQMDFDHLTKNKDRTIAQLVRAAASLERIKAEIAKCELVCANCHRLRTFNRGSVVE
jgi:hypothetical protein